MKPFAMSAAVAVAAIALLASPGAAVHRSAAKAGHVDDAQAMCARAAEQQDNAARPDVSEISWFQGTLDEAFARRSHGSSHHGRVALFEF
jgi:hypothetical protein